MLVFALDLAVPVLVVQVLYIPLIILAAWSLPPLATWLYFVFCAVMAVYDVEYESQLLANNQLWIRIANEVILACCGAVITGLALSSRRHGKQLNETYRVLRGSEEQLRHFVEQVPAAVAMFDQEMRYLAHSRRWVTDLHIPPENIIGRHHYEDLPNFPQRWKDDHRRALQGEVVRRNDEFFCEFNGRTDYSRSVVHPWFKSNGQIGGVVILAELITERTLLEEQLRDSEALYRSLVENIPQCVFRKDLQGRFTYANTRFCEAIGKSVEQVLGMTDFEHCPPQLASKYRADDQRVVQTGTPLETVEDLRAPDGSLRTVRTVKTSVVDAEGRVIGTQGIFWDITEKRCAEDAVRRSEREFRALADNLPDIVARFDRQYRHIFINRTVESVTGIPAEQFLGKSNADLGMPDNLVCLWHKTMQAVFDTGDRQTIEFAYDGRQGLRHFESRFLPEFAPDGSVESTLAICRDVTDRVRSQEQAQQNMTELAHITRLCTIGGLVSEISHEINQPLHAIANFAQAGINELAKSPLVQRPNLFNWLKQISQQANRAAEIIRRAGRFGRKTHLRSTVNINELVRDCLLLFNFDVRVHQLLVRCELAENLPLILADAIQIQQVLINLLRNAVEALGKNSISDRTVLVRTEIVDDAVQVAVHDNGCGIGADRVAKLFEPFFSTKSEGMGLGLAVCQSIVQSHQGRLWVESNSAEGTTFYFTLPIFKEEPHHAYSHP